MPITDLDLTVSLGETKPGSEDPSNHIGRTEGFGDAAQLFKLYAQPY